MKINLITNPCNTSFKKNIEYNNIFLEIRIIEDTLIELAKDINSTLSCREISEKSGLSVYEINKVFRHPCGSKVYYNWLNLKDERADFLARKSKYEKKYSVSPDPIYYDPHFSYKYKNKRIKALEMLKAALDDGRKISYQEIEQQTGLTKPEVDRLILDYKKMKEDNIEQEKLTKKMHDKWYEEHCEDKK